jgi:hypothetical protein
LSELALQDGAIAMAIQTQNGVKLNIRLKHVIVPEDLRFTAKRILESTERRPTGDTDVAGLGTANVLRGEGMTVSSDDRIGVAGVTDPRDDTVRAGTATNWFGFADPRVAPTIEVGYLRGTNRRPVIRSYVLTQGQWGIGWDVNMDIGAKALTFQACYRGNT